MMYNVTPKSSCPAL